MTMYARIPPRKARKNHPPPTKRYHHAGVTYRVDAEPDTNPRWYRVDDELAEELEEIRMHDESPTIFEVISESVWERRIEKRIVVSVVDVEGGEKTAKVEKVVSDGGSKSARSKAAPEASDDGHVDVGKTPAAKKKPAKRKTKKKTAKKAAKRAPRASPSK